MVFGWSLPALGLSLAVSALGGAIFGLAIPKLWEKP